MTQEEKTQLYSVFEPVLRLSPKHTHDDLIVLYYHGINYIKNAFVDKSREVKAAAMYYLKLHYENGIQTINVDKIINDFFTIYDNEYEKSKEDFSRIFNEEYYLLGFTRKKFFTI